MASRGVTADERAPSERSERRDRVTDVTVWLTPPPALPAERRDAFYAVAAGRTVHHTLEQLPAVAITLTDTERDEDGGQSGPTTVAAGPGHRES